MKIDTQLIPVAKNKPLQAIIENIFIKGRITALMSICEQLKTMIQTEWILHEFVCLDHLRPLP